MRGGRSLAGTLLALALVGCAGGQESPPVPQDAPETVAEPAPEEGCGCKAGVRAGALKRLERVPEFSE